MTSEKDRRKNRNTHTYRNNMPPSDTFTMVVDRSSIGQVSLVINADFAIPTWGEFPVEIYKPGDEVPEEHNEKLNPETSLESQ